MDCPYCGAPNAGGRRGCVRCNAPLPPYRPTAAPVPPPEPPPQPVESSVVFPLKMWPADKPWNLPWVRWLAFFVFFPLACRLYYQERLTLESAAWAFGLYFACIWGLILRQSLRLKQVSGNAIVPVAAGAMVLASIYIRAVYLVGFQFQEKGSGSRNSILGRAADIVLVGLVEEALKALPLIYGLLKRKLPTAPREVAFLGAVSGLAFGVAEAVQYSFLFSESREMSALLRLIASPLLHALWAGVTGYFLGRAATFPERSRFPVVAAVVGMGTLHDLFDRFADSWISIPICLVSLILFVGYSRAAEEMAPGPQ